MTEIANRAGTPGHSGPVDWSAVGAPSQTENQMEVTPSATSVTQQILMPAARGKAAGRKLDRILGHSGTVAPMERRRHKRLPVGGPAIIRWQAGGEHEIAGTCLDVSEGGAHIQVDELVPPRTPVHLRFPDLQADADGEVRHVEERSIGVEFAELTYHGPHRETRSSSPPREPENWALAALGVALLFALASGVPGLLPGWLPFAKRAGPPLPLAPASFTLGSTKSEVYAVQGPPTLATPSAWHYGSARVFFRGNIVSGWSDSPKRGLSTGAGQPRKSATTLVSFTVGSTPAEVLAAQGPPDELRDDVWRYGKSEVYFRDGKVVGWRSAPEQTLKTELPGPGRQPPGLAKTGQSEARPQTEVLTTPVQ